MTSEYSKARGRHKRTILFGIVEVQGGMTRLAFLEEMVQIPGTIAGLLPVASVALAMQRQSAAGTAGGQLTPSHSLKDYRFYDLNLQELDAGAFIASVPKPGVVIAIPAVLCGVSITPAVFEACYKTREVAKCKAFTASHHGHANPIDVSTIDAFISYSSKDSKLAEELAIALKARGAEIFLAAQSIGLSKRWEESLRAAILGTKLLVLLATRESAKSEWVQVECGAAWVLDKPICVARVQLDESELVAFLPNVQSGPYDTQIEREAFLTQVEKLIQG